MKIGDRVKTTPLFAKEFAKEFAGVITKIDTQPVEISKTCSSGFIYSTGEYHPTKTRAFVTIKTDTGDIRSINIEWLMSAK
jgi:hypothetical protein